MKYILLVLFPVVLLRALPSYTGYSGGTGSKGFCSASCHGSGTGTISITGFPQTYEPLATYTITVRHNGGSKISNFNASSRKGLTTVPAGSFTAGTNSVLYSVASYESGVRAGTNSIDSAVFKWTAPAAGTGEVKIYLAGLQGTKSGTNTKLTVSSSENVTGVARTENVAGTFELAQNFPNPFNPSTVIWYTIPSSGYLEIVMFDMLGNEIQTLFNGYQPKGSHAIVVDVSGRSKIKNTLSSGIYFYSLRMNGFVCTKKMMVLK